MKLRSVFVLFLISLWSCHVFADGEIPTGFKPPPSYPPIPFDSIPPNCTIVRYETASQFARTLENGGLRGGTYAALNHNALGSAANKGSFGYCIEVPGKALKNPGAASVGSGIFQLPEDIPLAKLTISHQHPDTLLLRKIQSPNHAGPGLGFWNPSDTGLGLGLGLELGNSGPNAATEVACGATPKINPIESLPQTISKTRRAAQVGMELGGKVLRLTAKASAVSSVFSPPDESNPDYVLLHKSKGDREAFQYIGNAVINSAKFMCCYDSNPPEEIPTQKAPPLQVCSSPGEPCVSTPCCGENVCMPSGVCR